MATIGTLVVDLKTNTSNFTQGMGKARKSMSATKRGVGALSKAVAGLGGALSVVGFAAAIKKSADLADQTGKTAQKLGLTTEALSELRFAAEQTGVGSNQLEKGLQNMTRVISEAAQGTGLAVDALDELGLSADRLNRQSPDQAFRTISEAMKGVELQSDKVRIAYDLMGGRGIDLIRTMDLGADGLDEMADKAQRLGIVISQDTAMAAAQLNDDLNELSKKATGLGQELLTDMVGPLTRITGAMAEAAKESGILEAVWVGLGGIASELFIGDEVDAVNDEIENTITLIERVNGMPWVDGEAQARVLKPLEEKLFSLRAQIFQMTEAAGPGVVLPSAEGLVSGEESPAVVAKRQENEMMSLLNDEAFQDSAEFSLIQNEAEFEAAQQRIQIAKDEADSKAALERMAATQRLTVTAGLFGALASLASTGGKKFFEIQKTFATAQALMDTYVGAQKAVAQGGIWGAVAAGAIIVQGLARVRMIQSAQPGSMGGGGGGGGSIPMGGGPGGAAGLPSAQGIDTSATTPAQNVNVTLSGDNFSAEGVRDLMELINDELGDGVKLNVETI